MGKKGLLYSLIVLAVVGVIAAVAKFAGGGGGVSRVDSQSTTTRKLVIENFPINEVASVSIRGGDGGELTLSKAESGWVVAQRDDFPAKGSVVNDLLRDVWDLKVTQPVPIGPSHLARLKLADPSSDEDGDDAATVLTFLDGEGEKLADLWLGKVYEKSENRPNPFGGGMATSDAGRYVKTGDSNAVFLVSETFSDVKTDPTDWLQEDFFKVDQILSISVDTGNPEEDWKLVRNDLPEEFTLDGAKEGEELDTAKTSSMKNAFSFPKFDDVYTGEEAKEQKTDRATFTVETAEGFRYKVAVGEENETNEMPLVFEVEGEFEETRKPTEEESDEEKKRLDEMFASNLKRKQEKLAKEQALAKGRVYKVRNYVVSSILKKREDLLKPPPEPETPGIDLPGLEGKGKADGKGGKGAKGGPPAPPSGGN